MRWPRSPSSLSPRQRSLSGPYNRSVIAGLIRNGFDISGTAVARSRKRCPQGQFQMAGLEYAGTVFESRKLDLITACEVLYYAVGIRQILPALQARTDRLYVSNYIPCSGKMRHHLEGEGW